MDPVDWPAWNDAPAPGLRFYGYLDPLLGISLSVLNSKNLLMGVAAGVAIGFGGVQAHGQAEVRIRESIKFNVVLAG